MTIATLPTRQRALLNREIAPELGHAGVGQSLPVKTFWNRPVSGTGWPFLIWDGRKHGDLAEASQAFRERRPGNSLGR